VLGAGAPRGRPCQPSATALQPAADAEQTRRHALVGGAAALAASLLVPGCGLRRECASAGTRMSPTLTLTTAINALRTYQPFAPPCKCHCMAA